MTVGSLGQVLLGATRVCWEQHVPTSIRRGQACTEACVGLSRCHRKCHRKCHRRRPQPVRFALGSHDGPHDRPPRYEHDHHQLVLRIPVHGVCGSGNRRTCTRNIVRRGVQGMLRGKMRTHAGRDSHDGRGHSTQLTGRALGSCAHRIDQRVGEGAGIGLEPVRGRLGRDWAAHGDSRASPY